MKLPNKSNPNILSDGIPFPKLNYKLNLYIILNMKNYVIRHINISN